MCVVLGKVFIVFGVLVLKCGWRVDVFGFGRVCGAG